jgi:hypothetical protein
MLKAGVGFPERIDMKLAESADDLCRKGEERLAPLTNKA